MHPIVRKLCRSCNHAILVKWYLCILALQRPNQDPDYPQVQAPKRLTLVRQPHASAPGFDVKYVICFCRPRALSCYYCRRSLTLRLAIETMHSAVLLHDAHLLHCLLLCLIVHPQRLPLLQRLCSTQTVLQRALSLLAQHKCLRPSLLPAHQANLFLLHRCYHLLLQT